MFAIIDHYHNGLSLNVYDEEKNRIDYGVFVKRSQVYEYLNSFWESIPLSKILTIIHTRTEGIPI